MQLRSPAFADGAKIPRKYTQDGADVSPPLEWRDLPDGTRSLALIVDDPDAPDPAAPREHPFVHWVVCNLRPDLPGLPEDAERVTTPCVGTNDWNRSRWDGPAPPVGEHRYRFHLYALDCELDLDRPSRARVEQAIRGHILDEAELVGTYKRDGRG